MRALTLIFILILTSLGSAFTQNRMYLVAGQSNARGRGSSSQSPETDGRSFEFSYNEDTLVVLSDPVGERAFQFESANSGSFLPAFANSLNDFNSFNTILIHTAKGGSSIIPAADLFGNGNWSATGAHFSNCVAKVNKAIDLLDVPLSGVIWSQGEMEGLAFANTQEYKDALIDLIERFRAEFGDIPFYIIETGRYTLNVNEDNAFAAIRNRQREVAAEIPGVYIGYGNTENFPSLGWMKSDGIHYNQDGLNDIGTVLGEFIPTTNVAPAEFSLAVPAQNALFEWDRESSIQFQWDQSDDLDQINYILELSQGSVKKTINILNDSSWLENDFSEFQSGTIEWQVSATDGIDTTSSEIREFIIDIVSNTVQPESLNPLIYPNPFKETFTISTANGYENQVFIYDAHGRLLISDLLSPHHQISTKNLIPGIYFIQIPSLNFSGRAIKIK